MYIIILFVFCLYWVSRFYIILLIIFLLSNSICTYKLIKCVINIDRYLLLRDGQYFDYHDHCDPVIIICHIVVTGLLCHKFMFSIFSHLNQTLLTLHIKGINLIVERNLHKYPIIMQLSPQTIIVTQFGKATLVAQ